MSNKHGEVSYNDDLNFGNNSGKEKEDTKDLWLRLENGSNKLRLLTSPYQYVTHKGVKAKGESGFGKKISCSMENGACALCALGHKPSTRWLYGVLERKTGKIKVLDVPYGIFSKVRGYAQSDIWGSPLLYDFDIIVDKSSIKRGKAATEYYNVQPIPHKALTPAEQKLRDDFNIAYLVKKTEPLTFELAKKYLDKELNGGELEIPVQKEKDGAKTSTRAQKNDVPSFEAAGEEENVDDLFPPHQDAA